MKFLKMKSGFLLLLLSAFLITSCGSKDSGSSGSSNNVIPKPTVQ